MVLDVGLLRLDLLVVGRVGVHYYSLRVVYVSILWLDQCFDALLVCSSAKLDRGEEVLEWLVDSCHIWTSFDPWDRLVGHTAIQIANRGTIAADIVIHAPFSLIHGLFSKIVVLHTAIFVEWNAFSILWRVVDWGCGSTDLQSEAELIIWQLQHGPLLGVCNLQGTLFLSGMPSVYWIKVIKLTVLNGGTSDSNGSSFWVRHRVLAESGLIILNIFDHLRVVLVGEWLNFLQGSFTFVWRFIDLNALAFHFLEDASSSQVFRSQSFSLLLLNVDQVFVFLLGFESCIRVRLLSQGLWFVVLATRDALIPYLRSDSGLPFLVEYKVLSTIKLFWRPVSLVLVLNVLSLKKYHFFAMSFRFFFFGSSVGERIHYLVLEQRSGSRKPLQHISTGGEISYSTAVFASFLGQPSHSHVVRFICLLPCLRDDLLRLVWGKCLCVLRGDDVELKCENWLVGCTGLLLVIKWTQLWEPHLSLLLSQKLFNRRHGLLEWAWVRRLPVVPLRIVVVFKRSFVELSLRLEIVRCGILL